MDEETKNLNIIISLREADYRFLASFNNGPNRVFRTPYEILEAIGEEIDQLVIQKIRDESGIIPEFEADKLLKDIMGKLEKKGIVEKE